MSVFLKKLTSNKINFREEKVVVLQKEMKELKGYGQVERRAKKSYLPDPATDETLQFVEELNLRRKRLAMKLLLTPALPLTFQANAI